MITLVGTPDLYELEDILLEPEMFERICDDGIEPEQFDIGNLKNCWGFKCVNDLDEVVGCFIIELRNLTTIDVHIHILQKYRRLYALQCGYAFLVWFSYHAPEKVQKAVAQIPETMIDVLKFSEKCNFRREGNNRKSIMKGGILVDQIYLGQTRDEAIEFCEENMLWR